MLGVRIPDDWLHLTADAGCWRIASFILLREPVNLLQNGIIAVTAEGVLDGLKICTMTNKARKQLDFLIEFGDEEDIVEKARIWNPKITDTEIEKVVKLFRAAKAAKSENERVR